METRPTPVGEYEILTDFECPTASVRVFGVGEQAIVEPHVHARSMQIYVAIEGQVEIERDGSKTVLRPYEAVTVWPQTVHAARVHDGESAVLMNISVPPLGYDDQAPVSDSG